MIYFYKRPEKEMIGEKKINKKKIEMLIEISKRKRVKPVDFIAQLIEKEYNSK